MDYSNAETVSQPSTTPSRSREPQASSDWSKLKEGRRRNFSSPTNHVPETEILARQELLCLKCPVSDCDSAHTHCLQRRITAALKHEGLTLAEAVARLENGDTEIGYKIAEYKQRFGQFTEADIERVRRLHEKGYALWRIAEEFKVSPTTIRNLVIHLRETKQLSPSRKRAGR